LLWSFPSGSVVARPIEGPRRGGQSTPMNIVRDESPESLDAAAAVIRRGGVVIVPTETFYGLAADPFRDDSVSRIFTIKSRSERKPLPLIAESIDFVRAMTSELPRTARMLMERFWPGSVTMLLRPARPLAALLTGREGKIGVRVPPSCPARNLAAQAGGLITSTSANLSGDADPDLVDLIALEVRHSVDLIMDLGPTSGGKPSTVIEPLDDRVRIVRDGAVPAAAIRDYLSSAL
jgi:L-threonylcarbamoyladenylate synthase